MKHKTQTAAILAHLKEKKTITTYQAFTLYGATRLSAIIFELRKKYNICGFPKKCINRFGKKILISKYVFLGEICEKKNVIGC